MMSSRFDPIRPRSNLKNLEPVPFTVYLMVQISKPCLVKQMLQSWLSMVAHHYLNYVMFEGDSKGMVLFMLCLPHPPI